MSLARISKHNPIHFQFMSLATDASFIQIICHFASYLPFDIYGERDYTIL